MTKNKRNVLYKARDRDRGDERETREIRERMREKQSHREKEREGVWAQARKNIKDTICSRSSYLFPKSNLGKPQQKFLH